MLLPFSTFLAESLSCESDPFLPPSDTQSRLLPSRRTSSSAILGKMVQETFHFINDPADAINDALAGLTHLKPDLSYNTEYKVVYRSDLSSFSEHHVTTIGFAGGGHEPMFGGFVGDNFLSAYVSGNIFASPTAAQIFEAIKMCQPSGGKGKGTLVVCGNYTGDVSDRIMQFSCDLDPGDSADSRSSCS